MRYSEWEKMHRRDSRRETSAESVVRTSEHMFDKCLSLVPMQSNAHCHRDIADSRISATVIKAGFVQTILSL